MATAGAPHVPVLLEESLAWLAVVPAGTYVDCTAGAGGHSAAIATRLGPGGRLIALDRDPAALALAGARIGKVEGVTLCHRNYGELAAVLAELGIAQVDGVLLDAGTSSMQLDQPARGFSFQSAGPLDMRMDPTQGPTAAELLRTTAPETVADWLRTWGDLRPARRIAEAIAARATRGALETTEDLRAAVCEALPFVKGQPDEVRTVFQAVRIAVNGELESLARGLTSAIDVLRPGGRLVVISFHSGEDRVAKQVLQAAGRRHIERHPDGRTAREIPPRLQLLTKTPVTPGDEECARNPRAKSARLRAAEKLPEAQ